MPKFSLELRLEGDRAGSYCVWIAGEMETGRRGDSGPHWIRGNASLGSCQSARDEPTWQAKAEILAPKASQRAKCRWTIPMGEERLRPLVDRAKSAKLAKSGGAGGCANYNQQYTYILRATIAPIIISDIFTE